MYHLKRKLIDEITDFIFLENPLEKADVIFIHKLLKFLLLIVARLIELYDLIRSAHNILCFHPVIELLQKQHLTYPEQQERQQDKCHEPEPDRQAQAVVVFCFTLQTYTPFLSASQ